MAALSFRLAHVYALANRVRDADDGQGLVEYALILLLVSVAAVVALTALSTQIQTTFGNVTTALGGA